MATFTHTLSSVPLCGAAAIDAKLEVDTRSKRILQQQQRFALRTSASASTSSSSKLQPLRQSQQPAHQKHVARRPRLSTPALTAPLWPNKNRKQHAAKAAKAAKAALGLSSPTSTSQPQPQSQSQSQSRSRSQPQSPATRSAERTRGGRGASRPPPATFADDTGSRSFRFDLTPRWQGTFAVRGRIKGMAARNLYNLDSELQYCPGDHEQCNADAALNADAAAWRRPKIYVDKVIKKCAGPGFSANGSGMGKSIIIDFEGGEANSSFSANTGWHGLSIELGQRGVNNPRTYKTLFRGAPRLPPETAERAPPGGVYDVHRHWKRPEAPQLPPQPHLYTALRGPQKAAAAAQLTDNSRLRPHHVLFEDMDRFA